MLTLLTSLTRFDSGINGLAPTLWVLTHLRRLNVSHNSQLA